MFLYKYFCCNDLYLYIFKIFNSVMKKIFSKVKSEENIEERNAKLSILEEKKSNIKTSHITVKCWCTGQTDGEMSRKERNVFRYLDLEWSSWSTHNPFIVRPRSLSYHTSQPSKGQLDFSFGFQGWQC